MRDSYSYPPRGLSREEAARFIGVGATTFDKLVQDGRMPKPFRIGKRVIWDRLKIDAAFSALGEARENFFDKAAAPVAEAAARGTGNRSN